MLKLYHRRSRLEANHNFEDRDDDGSDQDEKRDFSRK